MEIRQAMLVEWASDQEIKKKKLNKRGAEPPSLSQKHNRGSSDYLAPRTTQEKEREKRGIGREPGSVVDGDGGPMTTVRLLDAEVELGLLEGRERAVER